MSDVSTGIEAGKIVGKPCNNHIDEKGPAEKLS